MARSERKIKKSNLQTFKDLQKRELNLLQLAGATKEEIAAERAANKQEYATFAARTDLNRPIPVSGLFSSMSTFSGDPELKAYLDNVYEKTAKFFDDYNLETRLHTGSENKSTTTGINASNVAYHFATGKYTSDFQKAMMETAASQGGKSLTQADIGEVKPVKGMANIFEKKIATKEEDNVKAYYAKMPDGSYKLVNFGNYISVTKNPDGGLGGLGGLIGAALSAWNPLGLTLGSIGNGAIYGAIGSALTGGNPLTGALTGGLGGGLMEGLGDWFTSGTLDAGALSNYAQVLDDQVASGLITEAARDSAMQSMVGSISDPALAQQFSGLLESGASSADIASALGTSGGATTGSGTGTGTGTGTTTGGTTTGGTTGTGGGMVTGGAGTNLVNQDLFSGLGDTTMDLVNTASQGGLTTSEFNQLFNDFIVDDKIQVLTNMGIPESVAATLAPTLSGDALQGLITASGALGGTGGVLGTGLSTGSILSTGAGLLGSWLQGNAAQDAAESQAEAMERIAQMNRFRPVGVTTRFGSSQFGYDSNGNLTSAGYALSPDLKAIQDQQMGMLQGLQDQYENVVGLGQGYLATTPQQQAQKYYDEQQAILATNRERELAQLENRLMQQGRMGLATGGTSTGMMAANPELEAYYNAKRQQDLQLAGQATQGGMDYARFGLDIQNRALQPFQTALGAAQGLEALGQQPMDLGINIGAQGRANNQPSMNLLAQAAQARSAGDAYSPWGSFLQGAGNMLGQMNQQQGTAWYDPTRYRLTPITG